MAKKSTRFYWKWYVDSKMWAHSDLFKTHEECMCDMNRTFVEFRGRANAFNRCLSGKSLDWGVDCGENHISYGHHLWKIIEFPKSRWWNPKFEIHDIVRKGNITAIVCGTNPLTLNPENYGYRIVVFGCGHVPKEDDWPKTPDYWISDDDEKNWHKIATIDNDSDMIAFFSKFGY